MKDRDDSRDEDRSPLERGVERDRREIRAELADHVARRAKALEADGMSAAEARAEARRRLGDHVQLEDELLRMAERRGRRRVWLGRLDALRADVRHALRGMRRRPVLNAGIVLTMGLDDECHIGNPARCRNEHEARVVA
jgi:hypothetical protein